ncbi:MAG TPA: nitroreductase family deazaflavin-dependent oxidoreductase [Solirubrobacteraceae bacterium]|nr:nitroreductase family deazaflavin-dependent oxidoreductase [Solirubrobacteraceae bacterium]
MFSDHFWSRFSMSLGRSGLRLAGKMNIPVYRATRGRVWGKVGKAPVLLLTSTGRRSGQQRVAPVVYLADGANVIVIGSNAGNKNEPGWSFNLKANPDAHVEIGAEHRDVRARVAEGEERERLWKAMNVQYSGFDDYEAKTSRDIAVFVLEPR